MRILGVIPARGGSKGIPGKNIKPLCGIPLVARALLGARAAGCLDRLWVSTDDPSIAAVAEAYGAAVPWLRPPHLAGDSTPMVDVLLHLLERLDADEGYRPDALMLLQPTSPLRQTETLVRAASLLERAGPAGVVSVTPAHAHPLWCYSIDEGGRLKPARPGDAPPACRQELPPAYALDGSIYLIRREDLLRSRTLQAEGALALVIPPDEAVDLDAPSDWAVAEALLRARQHRPPPPRVTVIAEAGVNHNGDLSMALRLVEAAAAAGADAVKFQTFRADRLARRDAPKAPYQMKTAPEASSQHDLVRRLELDENAHRALIARCRELGIDFLSTPFDRESVDLLEGLGVRVFKLASGELTHRRLLEHVARKGLPMILSTGMSTMDEVVRAVGWIRDLSRADLTLLHCVSDYPAPPEQANLAAMDALRDAFGLPVGFSDHTPGIDVAIAAAARGAALIEKHLTLDRALPGPDHRASLEPTEFRAMVDGVRRVTAAIGSAMKVPAPCEEAVRGAARRSVVASRPLPAGRALEEEDLDCKRPGTGIPAFRTSELVGRRLKRPLDKDDFLRWEDLA
ncbi:MAG: N-acetylneuraminate synthase [Elusimicrobiota bacterium]|jgi:N-acetylneuraminate synthase